MPVLAWSIFRTLSWSRVRPSTESTLSETPHQLSQHGVRLHINWVNTEGTNIYEDFIIPRWLSWLGVSLHVDSVDMKSHLALTQLAGNETTHQLSHHQMLKNSNKLAYQEQTRKHSNALLFGQYMFDQCKKLKQKNLMQGTFYCRCYFNPNLGG